MKKTALALTLILTLLLSAAAGQLVNLTWANFIPYPVEPNEDPPTIALQSPHNETYLKNDITLNFTVTKPDSWTFDMITSINYILDDYEPVVLFNSPSTYTNRLPKETTYSKELTGLEEGLHSLQVNVAAKHFFSSKNYLNAPNTYTAVVSKVAYFTVDTSPPNITIQSPENKTYSQNDISLDFITNEPVSQITYSIDGQENMTISGNITLTGLSGGAHYLIVYAKDAGGIIGASEKIYFEIEAFPTILVVASILSAAAICVCLIVYFKKRHQ